ncbi:helix-turn-helix transcriptional regulator [Streptomyces fodineus]|uniref:helix-turn-helix domain-containing protein n=1 Tax=Streptomyces fodineus TaxID=1904616 RepID=UPI000AD16175
MPRPEKQLNPDASPRDWFGSEVRYWRKIRGHSASTLGPLVQASPSLIEKIEKGQASCRRDLAESLDKVLATGGVLTRAWGMVYGEAEKRRGETEKRTGRAVEGTVQAHQGRILDRDTSSPPGSPESVDRRAFLASSSLAAIAPIDLATLVAPSAPPTLPKRIRGKDISEVQAVAEDIYARDNAHGGGGLVGALATRAMQWAVGLLTVPCAEPLGAPLHAAVARLGIVVGASHFDTYAHDDARVAFKIAADCAEEANDWLLRAKVYSLLARQAVWIGDPDTGLTYAEKGLVRSDRLTPTIQAMLHTARARAFGKMGDIGGAMAAVGAADDAFAKSNPQDDPPWMSYYNEAQHHGDTGHALYDLVLLKDQDPGQASRRFEIAIEGHDDSYPRSRALSGTKLASLLMAKGDPHQATAIGHQAISDAGRLTSRRAADDLKELSRIAARHRRIPEVAYLRERISATLQT